MSRAWIALVSGLALASLALVAACAEDSSQEPANNPEGTSSSGGSSGASSSGASSSGASSSGASSSGASSSGGSSSGASSSGASSGQPATPRIAFVTRDQFQGGDFFGVEGADSQCQAAAEGHFPGTFLAWMASGSTDSPATRFTKSPLGYVRSDGVEIAASWDALVSGTLAAPIDRDELKEQVTRGFSVWSNATSNGNAFAPGDNASSCSGINGAWSASGTGTGRVGDLSKTDAKWADSTAQDCFSTLRIYCFQQ